MKSSPTNVWTQTVLPALFLFGGIGAIYGPAYVDYFQHQWLTFTLSRESLLGPQVYEVALDSDFQDDTGANCRVMLLANKDQQHSETSNRQELVLIDKWNHVVQRDLQTEVGAIQSSRMTRQDGYAVVEIVRTIPDNRRMAEVVRYSVTAERIAELGSEYRDMWPEWERFERNRRAHWRRRHRSSGRHPRQASDDEPQSGPQAARKQPQQSISNDQKDV